MVQDPVSQKYGNETRQPRVCYLLMMLLQSYCDAEWVDIKYLSILQMQRALRIDIYFTTI